MTNNYQFDIKYISKIILTGIKGAFTITSPDGIEIDSKKRYFEDAKKASLKKTSVIKKNIFWKPIIINDQIIGIIGIKTNKNNINEQDKLIDGLLDEISYQAFLHEQTVKYYDPKSTFIKDLLTTTSIQNFDQAIDKADILGLNLRSQQAVMVIEIPGLFKKLIKNHKNKDKIKTEILIKEEYSKIISVLKTSFKNYEQNIFTSFEADKFIALKWARGQINTLNTINFFKNKAKYISEVIKKQTGITPTIGVGQYYPGLSGLRKSYMDAKASLTLGKKIWGPEKIYHITDVGMFMALSPEISIERKCELAHQIIRELFEDVSLFKTVNIFLDSDMNLTVASKKLHLHRNTLIYRLEKIKKDTGLDPRKFSDAIQIKLGILLYGPKTKNC